MVMAQGWGRGLDSDKDMPGTGTGASTHPAPPGTGCASVASPGQGGGDPVGTAGTAMAGEVTRGGGTAWGHEDTHRSKRRFCFSSKK